MRIVTKTKKQKYSILLILILLVFCLILKTNVVKAEGYDAGGLPLEVVGSPKIYATEVTAGDHSGPLNLGVSGRFDSTGSGLNPATVKITGLNMIGGLSMVGFPDITNSLDLLTMVKSANYDRQNSFIAAYRPDGNQGSLLQFGPGAATTGEELKDHIQGLPQGAPVVQFKLRGDHLDNAYDGIMAFINASKFGGLSLGNYSGKMQLQLPVNPFYSPIGLPGGLDDSPSRVLTLGLLKPSPGNIMRVAMYIFGSNSCHNNNHWTPSSDIFPNSGATPTEVTQDINTWSNYIIPWDSKNEYNTATATGFENKSGMKNVLPGSFLARVVNWSLRKDGLPSAASVAKRFGRVQDFFTNENKPDVSVEAKKIETSDGADFELYSSDTTNRQYQEASNTYKYNANPVKLTLKYKVIPPTLDPLVTDKEAILGKTVSVPIQANAPTTNKMDLEYKYDSGKWTTLKTIDLSQETQNRYSNKFAFPSPSSPGVHQLSIKLTDHNGVESNVQSSNIHFYGNQVKFVDPFSSLSFGTHPISKDNTIKIKSELKLQDTTLPAANHGWTLSVRYNLDDATKHWEAANLSLSFSPTSEHSFINCSSTLTVNDESQVVASLPDETKKGTQENQTIALNPILKAPEMLPLGGYNAKLVWDLVQSPT